MIPAEIAAHSRAATQVGSWLTRRSHPETRGLVIIQANLLRLQRRSRFSKPKRRLHLGLGLALMLFSSGCASTPGLVGDWGVSPNPLTIPIGDFETVWRQSVNVLDEYFEIESENRLARRIVTKPLNSATLLEPFRGDTVTLRDRVEATLQSIRRFAVVTVQPSPTGTLVKVEVYKELEDVEQPNPAGLTNLNLDDDFTLVPSNFGTAEPMLETASGGGTRVARNAPGRWIPQGRDTQLEQTILARIREGLGY